jgi:hypothetical protein
MIEASRIIRFTCGTRGYRFDILHFPIRLSYASFGKVRTEQRGEDSFPNASISTVYLNRNEVPP